MNRSIRRLFISLSGGFIVLVLALGYWQVVAAPGLNDRPDNQQARQRERLIDRGRIISADGVTLARSVARRERGQEVFRRVYPRGALAAHTVGYTSVDKGRTGIESTYNRYLSGSFGGEPLLQRLNLKEKRGADVYLSLDTRVQRVAQDQLSGGAGGVVALDPRTGGVLAMASSPTFDLARINTDYASIRDEDGSPLFDRATQGRYPPGSTFKVVTTTAALESGIFTPDYGFSDTGSFATPGGPITNFGGDSFGRHTLTTALTFSINTTFARIGTTLGAERLGATMDAFGFGTRPPIDQPANEVSASGRLGPEGQVLPNDERGEDTARIAIGQEQLAVTPLQMAMVASGIANGGTLVAPRLMTRIVDRSGSAVQRAQPNEIATVASPEHAAQLTQMMTDVVNEGTGTAAALSDLSVTVAGKTGTAETADPGRNQAWFIGFAPADDPQVAVAVVIEGTPSTGGEVAAPVAAEVMRAALRPDATP